MITKYIKFIKVLENSNESSQYNSIIDYSYLNQHSVIDNIIETCQIAKTHNFHGVCVLPEFVSVAKSQLEDTNIKVITVINFPTGKDKDIENYNNCNTALVDGADEIDYVLNYEKLKKIKDKDDVEDEIYKNILDSTWEIVHLCHSEGKICKVIIETSELTYDEINLACQIAMECGADFVKTSTGYGRKGADVDKVKFLRSILRPEYKIEVSGGIKNVDDIKKFINYADRIGTSSVIDTDKINLKTENYSDISKDIGWNYQTIEIPSEAEIVELIKNAENGDEKSFSILFKLNRFAQPKNSDEVDRLNLAVQGYWATMDLYK